jgi:hypothetical protein
LHGPARIGDDDVVERPLFGPAAGQTYHHHDGCTRTSKRA